MCTNTLCVSKIHLPCLKIGQGNDRTSGQERKRGDKNKDSNTCTPSSAYIYKSTRFGSAIILPNNDNWSLIHFNLKITK